jgi:hypothetical protein
MNIISHRGYWKVEEEKNEPISFDRSFKLGFGTETDIRDYMGELVISHDIPNETCLTIDEFFKIYRSHSNQDLILALNIKSDGLQVKLKEKLMKFGIEKYFVFDMSIPDTLGYIKNNIQTFSRQSEHEPVPAFINECQGIWLDAFENKWYDANLISDHIQKGKHVAIVSPELHKRNHIEFWEFLKINKFNQSNNIILCTDLPEDATNFFNNKL